MTPGNVYWITGLSGAGKTTLCRELAVRLRANGRAVVVLDGDELREILAQVDAHTRQQRLELALRYAQLCRMIAACGVDVSIATISMFREVHEWNRRHLPGYVEIYLEVPLEELRRRDPKQIYSRATRGELKNVAGVDFQVDAPENPDVLIKWIPGASVESALQQIISQQNLK